MMRSSTPPNALMASVPRPPTEPSINRLIAAATRTQIANALMHGADPAASLTGTQGLDTLEYGQVRNGLNALIDPPSALLTRVAFQLPVGHVYFAAHFWPSFRALRKPGIYIVSKATLVSLLGPSTKNEFPVSDVYSNTLWFAAGYVGECQNMSIRHAPGSHHREEHFAEYGATVVFFAYEPDKAKRKMIERQLIAELDPPIHYWPCQ